MLVFVAFCILVKNICFLIMRAVVMVVMLLFSLNLYAQNTYVPDDNFEAALIRLNLDSGPLDDYVPTRNIDTLNRLELFNEGITDLTGLEDFTAMQFLNFDNNPITSVDLSNLTNLITINFDDNNLTSLDVSKNTRLTIIKARNNSITSLDVSNNPDLGYIEVTNNPIGTLDVSSNPLIRRLFLANTSLTELDVRNGTNDEIIVFTTIGNPNLNCIYVDNKIYSENNWINIDAQTSFIEDPVDCGRENLTNVPDDNFEQALIDLGYDSGDLDDYVVTDSINKIERLSVSNLSIRDLTGIEDFSSLRFLEVQNNLLQTINVSSLIQLQELNISSNTINTLNVLQNANLEVLILENTSISNLNVNQNSLLTTIVVSGPLTSLNLSNNALLNSISITSSSINFLDLRNRNNNSITSINLINNPNLSCVFVDDKNYSDTNWSSFIDVSTSFYENEIDCGKTCGILVDSFNDITVNNEYVLPVLTNGNYFSEPNGNGLPLFPGDKITTSQTIYIFNQDTTDETCFAASSFNVTINQVCDIPSFFTPNNDGINDIWEVNCAVNPIENIIIFNRFGKIIEKLPSHKLQWNGLKRSDFLPSSTYWYLINHINGSKTTGYFSLLRK